MNTYEIYILNYLNGSLKFIWNSGQILRRFGLVSFYTNYILKPKITKQFRINTNGSIEAYVYSEYT